MTQAFPDKEFSGIGGVSDFAQALSYFLLGCGTVQVCTAAMLDHAIGPNVIKRLNAGLDAFLEKHADKTAGTRLEDFRGSRTRSCGSAIADPTAEHADYQGGYEPVEGYAAPAETERDGDALMTATCSWQNRARASTPSRPQMPSTDHKPRPYTGRRAKKCSRCGSSTRILRSSRSTRIRC